jgi:hypothetical protein
MSLELGESEEFWREGLEGPTSKINKLDLLYGAMMYAVNKARQALKGVGETSASISSSLLRRTGSGII